MTANRFNFRVWDKENEKMVYPDGNGYFQLENDTVITGDGDLFDLENQEIVENCILMQSTGMVDKNNKEIFEGDIVKISQFIREDDKIRTIDFYDGQYQAMTIWGKDKKDKGRINIFSNSPYGEKWNIEVIGNIYENKELLRE